MKFKMFLKAALPYVVSFLIPIGIFGIALFVMPLFGLPRSVLYQDPAAEFIDMLSYYRRVLFGEENAFYSLSAGMGMATFPSVAFYLLSPFNLLIVLFPQEMVSYAFLLIVVLKIGAIGVTSYIFFRKTFVKEGNRWLPLIFSTACACSGYVLGYFFHFEFLDAVIMLPLVLLGIDKIIEGKKPWLYIITLALTIIVQYYMGFMVCIFSVIWFVYRLILKKKKGERAGAVKTFIWSSLLAGGLSAAILLPTAFGMMALSSRFDALNYTFESRFDLSQGLLQLTSLSSWGTLPLLFVGGVILVLFVMYFSNREISLKRKIASAIVCVGMFVCMNIKVLDAFWHAGTGTYGAPFRYSFILIFFIVFLAATAFYHFKGINKKWLVVCPFVYALLCIVLSQGQFTLEQNIQFCVEFLIIGVTCFLFYRILKNSKMTQKSRIGMLVAIGVLQVVSLGSFAINDLILISKGERGVIPLTQPGGFIKDMSSAIDELKEYDDGTYRTEKTVARSVNDGLQFGYNGVSMYSSALVDTPSSFGTTIKWYWSPNASSDIIANNTLLAEGDVAPLVLNSLFGIKYVVSKNEQDLNHEYYKLITQDDNFAIYRYKMALPLAYISNDFGDLTQKDDENTFDYLNRLVSKMQDNQSEVFSQQQDIECELQNLVKVDETYKKIDTEQDGYITYRIKNPERHAVYYYQKQKNSDSVAVAYLHQNQISEVLKEDNGELRHLGNLFDGFYLNLGTEAEIIIKVKILANQVTIGDEYFAYENTIASQEFYEKTVMQPTSFEQVSDTRFTGTMDVEKENQILLFTLPYDASWQVFVDGEQVEPEEKLGVLMALKVEPGQHTFELVYQPRGLVLGVAISGVCLVVLVGMMIYNRRCRDD